MFQRFTNNLDAVKAHTRTSKTGKKFKVQQYRRIDEKYAGAKGQGETLMRNLLQNSSFLGEHSPVMPGRGDKLRFIRKEGGQFAGGSKRFNNLVNSYMQDGKSREEATALVEKYYTPPPRNKRGQLKRTPLPNRRPNKYDY